MSKSKVALVYDRINKFGGAERVLMMLHEIYPEAPLYTLVHNPNSAVWAENIDIRPTLINKFPFIRSHHEILAPITSMAFESLNFDEYDVVISITSADAKAIITKPHTLHICMCLTPTRYLWSGYDEYRGDWKLKLIPQQLTNRWKNVDKVIANRPDYYIAISKEVQKRIKTYYGHESRVVYPAIDDKFFAKPNTQYKREGYLLVSRLVPYKKTELVIRAFNKIGKKLTVVGIGSQEKYLKGIAQPNISFKGLVKDTELIKYYQTSQALIFPQFEDFGLTPIEAQASGTPVIAYAKGGALETIVDKKTGFFFDSQTEESLIKAINTFEGSKQEFDKNCIAQAKKFTKDSFIVNFRDTVESFKTNYKPYN